MTSPFVDSRHALSSDPPLPDLTTLRERVAQLAFTYITWLALPVIAVAIYRATENGFSWYSWVQMLSYAMLLAGALWGRRIPSRWSSAIIVLIVLVVGIAGIAAWGPAPSRFVVVCFACVFAAIFLGVRSSLIVVTVATAAIALTALFHGSIQLLPGGDSISEHSPQQWVFTLLSFMLYTTAGCLLVGWVMQTLQKTICALSQREIALQHANDQLQNQAVQLEEQATELEEQAQVLMEQRDRAEQAAVAKDQFLSVVSHELRTPLNPILGFLEVMIENGELDQETADQLSLMKRSGYQLLRMIERVVDYSELDRGEFVFTETKVSCEDLMETVESRYRPDADERRLRLDVSTEGPSRQLLSMDRRRVLQIIDELASNALRFTEAGYIAIRFSLRDVKGDSGRICIRVSDTGCGIVADKIASLFDPFTQVDASRTRLVDGLGLGLAACDALARAMGGTIRVESQPHTGSTFTVELPVRIAEAGPTRPRNAKGKRSFDRPVQILVAEDDLVNQKVVKTLLGRMGASCVCVENGKQAVDAVRQSYFDVVLMDLSMPIMDGISATRAIRLSANGHRVPIVALTAHSYAKSEIACLEAGMDAFLTKPVQSGTLHDTISTLLRENRPEIRNRSWVQSYFRSTT